jgi:hypothetical protein
MAKSKARYLADVLQGDGSLVFSGDLSVPTTFTIDPLPSGAGGSVTIGGDLVSTGGLGNASLENSSITINSYNTSLGGTVTLVTDDVLEGGSPTNLYYTDARSRASISLTDTGGDGSLTYDSGTGAFTFTGPSAAETRAHFTAGTGVSITTGEIAIGQPVATTDAVTFSSVTGTGSSSFDTLTVTTTATVPYDNTISGLTATNVQSAITELNTLLGGGNIGSQATWNVYEFTTAGNDTSFDISTQGSPSPSYVPGYVKVYLNGLLLSESDYTAVDGTTVNFSPAITNAGQLVSVVVLDSFNTAELLRVTSIDASAATNTLTIDSLSNVGIGTASSGYKLDVYEASGNGLRIKAGDQIADVALSVGSAGTADKFVIQSGGNVGIGTTAPSELLEVRKDSANAIIKVQTGGGYDARLILDAPAADGAQSQIFFDASGTTAGSIQYTHNSGGTNFMTFHTGGSNVERMRIDASGNLSLYEDTGTTPKFVWDASAESLTITGNSNAWTIDNTTIYGNRAGNSIYVGNSSATGEFGITSGGAVVMQFDASGNVGIGTDNPDSNLHIKSTADVKLTLETDEDSNCWINLSGATSEASIGYEPSTNMLRFANAAGGITSNVRMSIDVSGNVGINDTNPDRKLSIVGDSSQTGGQYPLSLDATDTDYTLEFRRNGTSAWWIKQASSNFNIHENGVGDHFRISSGGNVGIGTTDQIGEKLTVNGSVQVLGSNDPNYSAKFISGYDATHGLRITTRLNDVTESEVLGVFADSGGASPRLVLNPTNGWNVGIGNTSPASIVGGTANTAVLTIGGGDGALTTGDRAGSISFKTEDASYTNTFSDGIAGEIASVTQSTTGAAYAMAFYTGTITDSNRGERMRLDPSGNLLVGKISSGISNSGFEVGQSGQINVTQAGAVVGRFNRKTSDGSILELQKDGAPVGSIGTNSGFPYIAAPANFSLMLATTDFRPRFKDLFLGGDIGHKDAAGNARLLYDKSVNLLGNAGTNVEAYNVIVNNGIYLGGTGAANLLEDYEEGTWTAGINYGSVVGTAATLSESGGSYVKVGRMVTVHFEADVSNTNSGSGDVYITGLPFTIDDIISPTGLEASGNVAYFTGFSSGVNSLALGADTAGGLALYGQTSSTQTAISSITAAVMGTGEIRGSITYFTT